MAITDNYNQISKVLRTDTFDDWKDKTNLILEDLIILEHSFGNWNGLRTVIGKGDDASTNNIVSIVNELDINIDLNSEKISNNATMLRTIRKNVGLDVDGKYIPSTLNVYADSNVISSDITLIDNQVEINRANIHANKLSINLNSTDISNLIRYELGLSDSKYIALREYKNVNGVLKRTTMTDDIAYLKSLTIDNYDSILQNRVEYRKDFATHDREILSNKIKIETNLNNLNTHHTSIGLNNGVYTSLTNNNNSISDDIVYLKSLIENNHDDIVDNTEEFRKGFELRDANILVNAKNILRNDNKLIKYLLHIGLDDEGVYTSLSGNDNSISDDILLLRNMIQDEDNVRGLADNALNDLIDDNRGAIGDNRKYIKSIDDRFINIMSNVVGLHTGVSYNAINDVGNNTIADDILFLKSHFDSQHDADIAEIADINKQISSQWYRITANTGDISGINSLIDDMQSNIGMNSSGVYQSDYVNTFAKENNLKDDISALDIKIASVDSDILSTNSQFNAKFLSLENRFHNRSNGVGTRTVSTSFPNPGDLDAQDGDIWYTVGDATLRSIIIDQSRHMSEEDVRGFIADRQTTGVIKVGDRLSITSEGVLSADEVIHPDHPAGVHAPTPTINDAGKVLTAHTGGTSWQEPEKTILDSEVLSETIILVGQIMYPVGSVYINAHNNEDPSVLFGFGTWVRYAEGRMLLSTDKKYTDWRSIHGSTGGDMSTTLAENNLPKHTHLFSGDNQLNINGLQNGVTEFLPEDEPNGGACIMSDGSVDTSKTKAQCDVAITRGNATEWRVSVFEFLYNAASTVRFGDANFYKTSPVGAGNPMTNMPPYITTYMWKRVS